MDEFEIVKKTNDVEIKMEPQFSRSLSASISADEKKEALPLSTKAQSILDHVGASQQSGKYSELFGSDISNYIVEGREVSVTRRMITRAYGLLQEIIRGDASCVDNINLLIIYACNVANREYLKSWQDKQMLVLIILRKYVDEFVDKHDQPATNSFIESHVPIIVEKIAHPKRRFRLPNLCCSISMPC